ncbi:MAG: UDP-N-acetylmuramoyl-L-alanine--D-glutamate ligase [Alphaproteobacteria bacterium]|nr:UDP-N-acetylmuramoyl-L-alanine--D-glutamate ligase [Alphaproteobacteria bacterium]
MNIQELKNKKILVWGFGTEGKAVVRLLLHNSIHAAVLTDKTVDEKNKKIIGYEPEFAFLTSKTPFEDGMFDGFDVIVKSPGISLYSDDVQKAKEAGIKFTSATNILLSEIMSQRNQGEKTPKIIAITGTKGKSTTASLCTFLLEKLGYSVGFAGNIGVPPTDVLSGSRNVFDYIILELSSYQTADLRYSPDIAVLLNLYPEHLEWHKSHEAYYKDKTNLVRVLKQNKDTVFILNAEDNKTHEMLDSFELSDTAIAFNDQKGFFCDKTDKAIKYNGEHICDFTKSSFQLQGFHNMQNACAVLTIIKALGLDYETAATYIGSFAPLPHRLQIIGSDKNGITFVDDSISTTPETAMAGLKTFSKKFDNITMIMGGMDRQQDFSKFAKFATNCSELKNLVIMHDTAQRIAAAFSNTDNLNIVQVKDMEAAVNHAKTLTSEGGAVLLSPAAPSYGFYKNFEERGIHFRNLSGV